VIRIKGLKKSFGDRHILKGVDLHCVEGSTTVILGGSGAGKSVLMKHVVGLLYSDEGELVVDGVSINGCNRRQLADLRNRMGMVFQQSALFDSMSVFDNVAFPILEAAREEISAEDLATRVHRALELFDLRDIDDLLPSALSGGMRKRVGLARAVIRQPKLLLYDEPTTGLDPLTTRQVDEMIVTARRELGVTSLVISHDIGSAFRIADQVAFLFEGKILIAGSPKVIQSSDIPQVRDFLATWRQENGS
jgi:phospholipid/cholesterol/gamma-HCH transport system ATP-binding protein